MTDHDNGFEPSEYMYLNGWDVCDWIVYKGQEVAFVTVGDAWYRRQGNSNTFVSVFSNPTITLVMPPVILCSLDLAVHRYKQSAYCYLDLLADRADITPENYRYVSAKNNPDLKEWRIYDIDWIVFDNRMPAFLLRGDMMNGFDWFQRKRGTSIYRCIDQENPTEITIQHEHVVQLYSVHAERSYDSFCRIERNEARIREKALIDQIQQLKSEKLEMGKVLAQMYANLPKAPQK
jgi:hypothetical protein